MGAHHTFFGGDIEKCNIEQKVKERKCFIELQWVGLLLNWPAEMAAKLNEPHIGTGPE